MMIKLATSTVQNDDLIREYSKSSDGFTTFRLSTLLQFKVCHTYPLQEDLNNSKYESYSSLSGKKCLRQISLKLNMEKELLVIYVFV
jgi:hypothetical protein